MTDNPNFSPSRPSDVFDMLRRSELFYTDESKSMWQAFRPGASDVIIATFPKSGTTWMQQILHSLRSGGDMDFDEISLVVPWLEVAFDTGIDLTAPQPWPRLYKSHLAADEIPRGARYVVIFRDPEPVLISYYGFMEGWFFEPGSISLDEFAQHVIIDTRGSGNYWHHLKSWWALRERPDVLMFCYEDMKADIERVVRRVAAFADIAMTDALLETTLEHSTHDFMRLHSRQFDEHATQQALDEICGLPRGGHASKVKTCETARYPAGLSAAVRNRLREIWRDEIEAATGLGSYAEFRRAVAGFNA